MRLPGRKAAIRADFEATFTSPHGRRALAVLAKENFALPHQSTFVSGDPHQSAMYEGRRRAIAGIFGRLRQTAPAAAAELEHELESYE